jgi:proline iminopeptidase
MRHIIKKGFLEVGDGHKMYFEEWGNPKAIPFFYLHGGPGSHFKDSNKLLFDPKKHHVIFHDQRGCGRSLPHGATQHNTTQDLIEDISRLASHLGIEKFTIVGGSWGSALSLLYAIANPKRVKQLLIWSIYLAREYEANYVNAGYPRYYFPEAWERFIKLVPSEAQKSGDQIMQYYAAKIRSKNEPEAKKYAFEWTLWEASLISMNYTPEACEQYAREEDNVAVAILETHYFLNNCFIPKDYILENIQTIAHIPCHIVQGRFDMCTPAQAAYDLQKAYGNNATLQITIAGHLRTEPENFKAIKAIAEKLVK